ncbi:unnamed protein product [Rhodiola kirilowii]
MGDAEVAEVILAPETAFPPDGLIPNDQPNPKSDASLLDEFKPDAMQQQHYYENPALVLDQLLPIDMSSPTLLINETPPYKNHFENSANPNPAAIDSLLEELDAPDYNSLPHDEVLPPPPGPDTPRREQSKDINPFHDAADQTATSSVSKNVAQINQPTMPDMELDLLQLSLDDQRPTTLSEPLKPDQTSENDSLALATNFDPFHNDQLPKPSEDIQIQHPDAAANLDSQVLGTSVSVDSPKYVQDSFGNRVLVDTAAPFESVKEAVSKFGGIVDWKAHKVQTVERRRFIEQELDKAQEDVPICRKMSDKAEEEKIEVLKGLEAAKRLAEEMKLSVERAQIEEHQAKQDAELVKLRVEEMEQGIAEESSVAAKAQLEVAKARQAAAVSDLQSAKEELENLRKEYAGLVLERDSALKKVEHAVAESKEVEKTVQDLTIELIAVKESLESAHAVHLEAEDNRLTAAMVAEQRSAELKEVEDEVKLLAEQVMSARDLQSKLDAADVSFKELKAELSNYMDSKTTHPGVDDEALAGCEQRKSLRRTHTGIQASVASAKNELEDVRLNIEKAVEEVELLKLAASSIQSEVEREKAEVIRLRFKNGERIESQNVQRLEVEVEKIETELAEVKVRVKEVADKMAVVAMRAPEAGQEAVRVESEAKLVQEELRRVKDETEQVKAEAIMMESRVVAAEKETEAARASESLALGAMKALQESDEARTTADTAVDEVGVEISLEEYYELSKRAHEAEERANAKVAAATAEVEKAKESQLRSLEKLEEVDQEVGQRKEELKEAVKRAEEGEEGKLRLEEELRKWRGLSEQRRQVSESQPTRHESSNYIRLPTARYASPPQATGTATEGEKAGKKKKKSFFPRILMFMARRKAHSSK